MNDRIEIAHDFAEAIKSYDIVQIILYGSVARGEDTEESDIDILIITPVAEEIRKDIISMAVELFLRKMKSYLLS